MAHTHDLSNHTHSLSSHTHTINHGHSNTIAVNTATFSGDEMSGKIADSAGNGPACNSPNPSGVFSSSSTVSGGFRDGVGYRTDVVFKATPTGSVSVTLKGGVTDHSGSSGGPSNNTSGTPSNNTSGAASNSNTTYNGSSTDTESRPNNYSYIIWKRIA